MATNIDSFSFSLSPDQRARIRRARRRRGRAHRIAPRHHEPTLTTGTIKTWHRSYPRRPRHRATRRRHRQQQNLLTGTEVWTVPGRGNRPLAAPRTDCTPIDHEADGHYCAFCSKRYLETPPEKSRLVRHDDGTWEQLDALSADKLSDTVAEFRRIPNLFEIVSYNYWHLNHGTCPPKRPPPHGPPTWPRTSATSTS